MWNRAAGKWCVRFEYGKHVRQYLSNKGDTMKARSKFNSVVCIVTFIAITYCAFSSAQADVFVFSYTGTDQTWTVPAGVAQITVKAWGAGGAGGNYIFNDIGGGGGFVTGTLDVTPGEQLTIIVGGGGQPGAVVKRVGGSRAWLSKWQTRFGDKGSTGLCSQSCRPHTSPRAWAREMARLIVQTR